jgi:hypothetical protein
MPWPRMAFAHSGDFRIRRPLAQRRLLLRTQKSEARRHRLAQRRHEGWTADPEAIITIYGRIQLQYAQP